MNNWILLLVVFLSIMLLTGDYCIKYAVGKSNWLMFLVLAGLLWCASIYGWFYTLKENRIAIVGMLFSVVSLIGTVLIGIIGFHERLSITEWVGLAFGIISAILLSGKI